MQLAVESRPAAAVDEGRGRRAQHAPSTEVDVAQEALRGREVARASRRSTGCRPRIPLLTALCGVLALLGVRKRLEEYR